MSSWRARTRSGGTSPRPIAISPTRTAACWRFRTHVRVDLDEAPRGLRHLTLGDRGDWDRVRALLRDAAGESTSEIWLDQLELTAVAGHGTLVLGVNQETASWVRERFRRLLFGRRVKRVRREF